MPSPKSRRPIKHTGKTKREPNTTLMTRPAISASPVRNDTAAMRSGYKGGKNRKSGNLQMVSDLMVPNAGRNCPSLPPISNFGTYSEPSRHRRASAAARPSCCSRACYNAFKPEIAMSLSPVAPFSAEMVVTPLRRPWARPGTSASRQRRSNPIPTARTDSEPIFSTISATFLPRRDEQQLYQAGLSPDWFKDFRR